MDYGLSEEQGAFRRAVRSFLREESPLRNVRQWEASEEGYDPALHRRIGELGWLSLRLPEQLGGQEATWIEEVILYNEFGTALLPGPHYTSSQCAHLLAAFGSEAQQNALVPPLASGTSTAALALAETGAGSNFKALRTVATPNMDGYRVSGEKPAVEFGHAVDALLVAAQTEDSSGQAVLLLVDRRAPGVTAIRLETMGGEPRALIKLDGVQVPAGRAIVLTEEQAKAAGELLHEMRLCRAAELVGMAEAALNLSVEYAHTRVQYGRPIGAFQAIQHKLANVATQVELARWPVYHAAWRLAEGMPADPGVARAVAKSGDAARWVTAESVQAHGGVGVMEDSDVSLYYRRAKARQLELGYPDQLRERVAVALGL